MNCKDKNLPNGEARLHLRHKLLLTHALFHRELRSQLKKLDSWRNAPDLRKKSMAKTLKSTSRIPELKSKRRLLRKKKPSRPMTLMPLVTARKPKSRPRLRPKSKKSMKKLPKPKKLFSLRRSMLPRRKWNFLDSKKKPNKLFNKHSRRRVLLS